MNLNVLAALVCAAGAACVASARPESVIIDLANVRIQNGLNQARTSAPNTIDPARLYRYEITGMVRGSSGLLALVYPTPVPLAQLLESFQPGSSEVLQGYGCNPPGTHPVTFIDEAVGGQAPVGGVTATISLHMTAGIEAGGVALFSFTNVVLTPTLLGSMTFTSGQVLMRRIACPADFNDDGALNLADFGAFQTAFALGQERADFNCDGALNLADFGAFQTAFALGCP